MLKILIGLVIAIWISYGLFQFANANRINSVRPYFERQINYYMEMSNAAAIISTSDNPEAVETAKARFKQLSTGPMIILGDETVTWSISLFATCMAEPEHEKCKQRDLSTITRVLSKAMRNSLAKTANLNLDNMTK